MVEASFLMAMDRVVGGVQVQHNLLGCEVVRRHKCIDHPAVDLVPIHGDLLVSFLPIDRGPGQLQPVQRTLARQRLSPVPGLPPLLPQRIGLIHRHRQHRIVPQLVVIVQVLVAQTESVDALPQQLPHRVFDQPLVPVIGETLRHSGDQTRPPFHLSQQQNPSIGGDLSPVEPRLHFPMKKSVKFQCGLFTLCRHKGRLRLAC